MELKLLERKLDFWNLFENWSFENLLKIEVLEIKFKNWNFGNWKLSLKNWNFRNCELNLKSEFLRIYLKMEFFLINK